ncbi:unnamed protein product, partial [Nippostrongylus brasiliensis]|uniref:WD_REPEATS_REGION domain-containing protein n=1 Tax=Nippostrongylus brasiliensis TaxID=27835 RepID=A0A158QWH3_NIPBR
SSEISALSFSHHICSSRIFDSSSFTESLSVGRTLFCIFSITNCQLLKIIKNFYPPVIDMSMTPSRPRTQEAWAWVRGTLCSRFTLDLFSATGVGSLAFSMTGKTLMAGFWDGSVRAFSVQKLAILLYLDFHSETITQIQWSEVDGDERVMVASMDERLSLWKFK